MSRKVIFHRLVRPEISEVKRYYERQRKGLGNDFVAAIRAQLGKIEEHPEIYGVIEADIRVAILPRFPYAVYFRLAERRIQIIAVIHTSRDSSIWRTRS